MHLDPFQKIKNISKQDIPDIFIKMSYIRITPPDKVCHEVFNIVDSPLYNGYQRGLAVMFYRFFEEKSKGSAVIIYRQNEIIFF